jgi:hypothetical protein
MLNIITVLLAGVFGSIIFGFAGLGASYFFDSLEEYEREAEHFIDEK